MAVPADKTIAQLDSASIPDNSDLLVLYQALATKKLTISQLLAKVAQGVPNPPSLPPHALAYITSAQTWGSTHNIISWDAVEGTETGLWDAGNPSRLTVPTGASYVRISANWRFKDSTAASGNRFYVLKNGGIGRYTAGQTPKSYAASPNTNWVNLTGPPEPVTPGDYFQMRASAYTAAWRGSASTDSCWFCMEILA